MGTFLVLLALALVTWGIIEILMLGVAWNDGEDDSRMGRVYRNDWSFLRAYAYELGYEYREKNVKGSRTEINRKKFNR